MITTSVPKMGCLDAQAIVCYELDRLFRRYDPYIARYLEDLGKSYQANDAKSKLMAMRLIEKRLEEINEKT